MNLEPELEQVRREYLRRMTQGDNTLLRQVEDYISARNGKMLRPRLLLTAAATRGDEALRSRRTQLLAVCVEMLHNASLLHDDIIDRADTRRGQPSVNARWGNAVAVLVGDWILAQIMRLLDEVDDRQATRLVNNTVIDMVQAELLQLTVAGGQRTADSTHGQQSQAPPTTHYPLKKTTSASSTARPHASSPQPAPSATPTTKTSACTTDASSRCATTWPTAKLPPSHRSSSNRKRKKSTT